MKRGAGEGLNWVKWSDTKPPNSTQNPSPSQFPKNRHQNSKTLLTILQKWLESQHHTLPYSSSSPNENFNNQKTKQQHPCQCGYTVDILWIQARRQSINISLLLAKLQRITLQAYWRVCTRGISGNVS